MRDTKEQIEAKFNQWREYLGLADYGYGVPVADRLRRARQDIQEFRRTNNFKGASGEEEALAVRVVCDTLADQILTTVTEAQDTDTVRWVVAGLRCPARPFCTGCSRCATVTSPQRPTAEIRSWL